MASAGRNFFFFFLNSTPPTTVNISFSHSGSDGLTAREHSDLRSRPKACKAAGWETESFIEPNGSQYGKQSPKAVFCCENERKRLSYLRKITELHHLISHSNTRRTCCHWLPVRLNTQSAILAYPERISDVFLNHTRVPFPHSRL